MKKNTVLMISALAVPLYFTMFSSAAASEAKDGGGSATKQASEAVTASPPPIPGSATKSSKASATGSDTKKTSNPVVVIETSMGTIKAELWADKAPGTVANFLQYVKDKYYDGLIFHRVIDKFMIQGGGFSADMKQKATRAPIKNEARSDVKNGRGTLAMARTSNVDSATSQFFINLVNNGFLNHRNKSAQGFGYCAFGKVTAGMDVVDKMAKVKTGNSGGHQNVPLKAVTIVSIRVAE